MGTTYYMLNEAVDEALNSFNSIDENNIVDNEYNSETANVDNDAEDESDKENNPNRFLSTREQLEKLDCRMMDGKNKFIFSKEKQNCRKSKIKFTLMKILLINRSVRCGGILNQNFFEAVFDFRLFIFSYKKSLFFFR